MEDKAQDTQRIFFFIVKTTVKVDQSSNETMVLKIFVLRSLFKKQLKQLAWVLGVQLSTQKIFFSSYYYQISVHFYLRSAEFQCVIDFCFLGISSGRETWEVCYEHPLVASLWLLISFSSTCILLRVKKSHCIDFTVVVSITIFLESLLINFLLKYRVSVIIHFLDASFDFIYKICFC